MKGKLANILLRTMGQQKIVGTTILTGLEVSGIDSIDFIELPNTLTHNTMPVSRLNIPRQEDVGMWSYLRNGKLHDINADVDLLIGTDAEKVMEPWELINSQGEGPYAVRTRVGWVINGPLRGGDNNQVKTGCSVVTTNHISVAHLEEMLIKQYNQDFNENTLEEQLELSREAPNGDQWKYVNTKVNPADEASRGMRPEEFLTRSRWIKGPEFLYLPEKEWPVADMDPALSPADDPEVKRETKVNAIVKYADNATNHFVNYFSSWRKLKVSVAWFLQLKRVLSLLSQKRRELKATESDEDARVKRSVEQKLQSFKGAHVGKTSTPQDYDEAEKAIICFVQKQRFASETTSLKGDSNVSKDSPLYKLDPILEDGII